MVQNFSTVFSFTNTWREIFILVGVSSFNIFFLLLTRLCLFGTPSSALRMHLHAGLLVESNLCACHRFRCSAMFHLVSKSICQWEFRLYYLQTKSRSEQISQWIKSICVSMGHWVWIPCTHISQV